MPDNMSETLPPFVIKNKHGKYRWQRTLNGDMVYSAHFKHLKDLEPLFPVLESCYKVLKRSGIEPKSVRGQIAQICEVSKYQTLYEEAIHAMLASRSDLDDRSSVDTLGDSISLVARNEDYTETSRSESSHDWVIRSTVPTSVAPTQLSNIHYVARNLNRIFMQLMSKLHDELGGLCNADDTAGSLTNTTAKRDILNRIKEIADVFLCYLSTLPADDESNNAADLEHTHVKKAKLSSDSHVDNANYERLVGLYKKH